MRGRAALALASMLCGLFAGTAARAAGPSIAVPPGYTVTVRQTIAPGVDRFTFVRRSPAQVVNVVRFLPNRYVASPALAANALGGRGVEKTSAICRRYSCVAAVNGDFFANRVPVGGIVGNGEVIRTSAGGSQISFDAANRGTIGKLSVAGTLTFTRGIFGEVAGTEVAGPLTQDESLTISGVNVGLPADRVVLYTPRFGSRTHTSSSGVELVLRAGARPWRSGAVTSARVVAMGAGKSAIPRDGAVVAAYGASAEKLRDLWTAIQTHTASPAISIRLTTAPNATASMGGYPVVLSGGSAAAMPAGWFTRGRQPRTFAGWTSSHILLVTFDGRQGGYSDGVSLPEAASFLKRIAARSMLNLDGGGSSTMVVRGEVINRPSDRWVVRDGRLVVERYVGKPGDRYVTSIERRVPVAFVIVKR